MTDADWLSQIARNVTQLTTATGELTGLLKAHTETSREFQAEARKTFAALSDRVATLEVSSPQPPGGGHDSSSMGVKKASGFLVGVTAIITVLGLAILDLAPRIISMLAAEPVTEQHQDKGAHK